MNKLRNYKINKNLFQLFKEMKEYTIILDYFLKNLKIISIFYFIYNKILPLLRFKFYFNWGTLVLAKESKLNCWGYVLSCIHWFLQKLMELFTFALYIRIILQSNQFILIAWVSEMYQFNFNETKRKISIIITFLILIAWMALIVITILFTFSKDVNKLSESQDKRSKFAHLFDGLSPNKKSRLFAWLIQIRRAIFVILLIILGPKSSIIVISFLVGLQFIYLLLLAAIRPYEVVIWNIIEMTNELYFLVILAFLLKYNTAADWKGTPITVYTS